MDSFTDSGINLNLLEGSQFAPGSQGIEQAIEINDGSAEVFIRNVTSAGLKSAFFSVDYDARRWQLVSSSTMDQADGRSWISLVQSVDDGRLKAGVVASGLADYAGLDEPMELLKLSFTAAGNDNYIQSMPRSTSAAPINQSSQSSLSIDQAGGKLNWEYRCTGDYDQNGLVSITDLTPLGIHFGKQGPFSSSSVESVVDGDGNGLINLGDITAIGQNFGRGVESYNVYLSNDDADYPENGTGSNALSAAGTYAFSSAVGTSSQQRLQFSRTTVITADRYYWVRPLHQGVEGIASSIAYAEVLTPVAPVADISADPTTGIAPLLVELDASGSTDDNGNIDHYDWDFENDGTYDVTTTVPQISRSYGGGPWTATVRVVDSGGLSDTASINLNFVQPSWNITTVDSFAQVFSGTRMVHVGGRPVIAYDQFSFAPTYDRLYVARGTDTQGSSWTSAMRIDNQVENVGQFDMDIVDGRAAISYYDANTGSFRYIRASSDDSSSWGNPIILETDSNTIDVYGKQNSLEEINGKPAVAFRGDGTLRIYYKIANDATGSSWGTRTLVSSVISGVGQMTLIDTGGNPGILWSSIPSQKVGYIRSNEVSGQFFNTDLHDGTPQLTQDLVFHQNQPQALYITGTPNFDARVAVAAEADGSSWEAPTILADASQNGCSMAVINGIPMVVITDTEAGPSGYLRFYRALDPSGSSWSDAEHIDGGTDQLVGSPCLIEISGAPAVSYAWSFNDPPVAEYELRFALYF